MRVKGLWEVQVFGVAPLGKKKWPKSCCQRRRCEKACLFSIYLSVCMSVHVSVCLFVHLCLSLSTCLSFSNLTHLSAAGETRKLNIWDSLSLSLCPWLLSLCCSPRPPLSHALTQRSLARPRLYFFFLLSSLFFPSLFSGRDRERGREGEGWREEAEDQGGCRS